MTYPYLKLVGGVLLFYVAIKLVTEDADGDDDGVEGAQTLWRAVRIVAIADIVMSLDNVIAIAASAEIAAAQVDLAHAAAHQDDADHLRPCHQRAADRRRPRDPDGAAGALPRAGLGRRRAARLGRGRHHGRPIRRCTAGSASRCCISLHIWGGPVGGLIVLGAGLHHRRPAPAADPRRNPGRRRAGDLDRRRPDQRQHVRRRQPGPGEDLGRPRRAAAGADRGLRHCPQASGTSRNKRSDRRGLLERQSLAGPRYAARAP